MNADGSAGEIVILINDANGFIATLILNILMKIPSN